MTAPVVTGSPDSIWLCYGDLQHDDTHAECCRSGEVTWCDARQDASDVRYVRVDLAHVMTYAYAVEVKGRAPALFLDRSSAELYAVRNHGIIVPLAVQKVEL